VPRVKCRGVLHTPKEEQKIIKQEGHNSLCPYKIIKTVSKIKRGQTALYINLLQKSSLSLFYSPFIILS